MNKLLLSSAAVIFALILPAAPLFADSRPNVLFLISDDQRFDTIRALGNTEIQTPNLDKLVEDGFVFTHAFCMGSTVPAVCAPSRSMILTGRSLYRSPINIPKELPTWPETMAKAGYVTFGTGKWHNGAASYARSFTSGAAIFFGGMSDHYKAPIHDFNPESKYNSKDRYTGGAFSSELFADAAIKFLQEYKKDKPFFLYVAFTAPHDPRTPPQEYADMYVPDKISLPKNFMPVHPFNNGEMKIRDEQLAPWPRTPQIIKQHIADYYGMITHMDAQIGRILQALEASGHADNTIIVFTSDQGLAVGQHGLLGKQNLYDHSVRSPLIFAGPSVPKDKKSAALSYLFDIFPTVCDLTGVQMPDTVEGKSLAPIMFGKKDRVRDSIFGAYKDVQRMARTDRWKLIRYPQINMTQLFDLKNDPYELNNLAGQTNATDRILQLTAVLADWQNSVGDTQLLTTDKPDPVDIELITTPESN